MNKTTTTTPAIKSFKDDYHWLSNFSPVEINILGYSFSCVEAAYCACKCKNDEDMARFVGLNGSQSKYLGRNIELRDDWNEVKLKVMTLLVTHKFKTEPYRTLLLQTGDAPIEEGNTWHDNFYGNCICDKCRNKPGQNHLGKLLMQIRDQIREECTNSK